MVAGIRLDPRTLAAILQAAIDERFDRELSRAPPRWR